jgi:hypothetical protein
MYTEIGRGKVCCLRECHVSREYSAEHTLKSITLPTRNNGRRAPANQNLRRLSHERTGRGRLFAFLWECGNDLFQATSDCAGGERGSDGGNAFAAPPPEQCGHGTQLLQISRHHFPYFILNERSGSMVIHRFSARCVVEKGDGGMGCYSLQNMLRLRDFWTK